MAKKVTCSGGVLEGALEKSLIIGIMNQAPIAKKAIARMKLMAATKIVYARETLSRLSET